MAAFIHSSAAPYGTDNQRKIFADTTNSGKVKIHHFIGAGLVAQLGKQYVRTYNNYDHTTYAYNNNLIGQNERFFSLRFGHEVLLKNVIAIGVTYGTDMSIHPHDIRALLPLMAHVSKYLKLKKRIVLLFSERLGYSFFLRTQPDDPFMQYPGIEGGFTSETVAGLNITASRKVAIQIIPGYRIQHLHSKMLFTPGSSLTQIPGFTALPNTITEISNGFYNCFYFSVNILF